MSATAMIEVRGLRKLFPVKSSGLFNRQQKWVHAVDGVSFEVARGEILALVGESGCGKSTLALTLLGLETPTEGEILIDGRTISGLDSSGYKDLRRQIQMVFQDPYESLNPLMTVGEIVAEPLAVHRLAPDPAEREARVHRALEDAGLKPAEIFIPRLPHELSGGQRQRVVIAGALVLEPQRRF